MTIYIEDFPFQIEPRQKPFDVPGLCPEGYLFIYMTNRPAHRWSYLLTANRMQDILDAAWVRIPMGYTQLWVFQKCLAVSPPPGAQACEPAYLQARFAPPHVFPPPGIKRAEIAGKLYIALREPLVGSYSWDLIASGLTQEVVQEAAYDYARRSGRRAVVGLLLADCYWH